MNRFRNFWRTLKGLYYLLRLALAPKSSILPLLKLGNLISESKAFAKAAHGSMQVESIAARIQERYGPGIPDPEALIKNPEGSLGHSLGTFMKKNELQAYPFPIQADYSTEVYLRERRREIHDILHVVLGYDTSLEGEAQLNAFLSGQSAYPIPVIISAGVLLLSVRRQPDRVDHIYELIMRAYLRGKEAQAVLGVRWEDHWATPLAELRDQLQLTRGLVTAS
ncbi:MAG: Coq4 family protein [Bacteroidota bacterium]